MKLFVVAALVLAFPLTGSATSKEGDSGTALPDGKGAIRGEAAILIDAFSGKTLYEKNADKRMFPASITKIVTALLVIEAGDLDGEVTIEEPETKAEPSKLYVKVGEKYARRDMLYALLLKSANDIAEALARDNAGSVEAFGKKMTARVKELGAIGSQFCNPHGLPNKEHYTTAHDMALIARAAMQQPLFREIVASLSHPWVSPRGTSTLTNHNRLLKQFEGATGLKTGWTVASGHTLVSAALRDNREVIAVVLKSTRGVVFTESERLLEYGLAHVPALPTRDILTPDVVNSPPTPETTDLPAK